jgi:two-component system C4-dicarboxylate transport response regulator DctD
MTAKTDASAASPQLNGRRVVVVDDDEALLRVLTTGLELSGYSVTAFDRFEDAKKHLAAVVPDVLITDVRLGGSNGLHLVVMSKLRHPEMVAVVMTGYDDVVLRKDAEAAGAHYVVKPILVADLVDLIAATPVTETRDR